jgi:hypothetical protein
MGYEVEVGQMLTNERSALCKLATADDATENLQQWIVKTKSWALVGRFDDLTLDKCYQGGEQKAGSGAVAAASPGSSRLQICNAPERFPSSGRGLVAADDNRKH